MQVWALVWAVDLAPAWALAWALDLAPVWVLHLVLAKALDLASAWAPVWVLALALESLQIQTQQSLRQPLNRAMARPR